MRRIFGEHHNGTKHDVLKLAIDAKQQRNLPNLWIDCGTDDYLITDTRAFHRELDAANIPHDYHEFPGAHDWAYCDQHIEAALAFYFSNLAIVQLTS